jgi:hypothetical protein
MSDSTLQHSVAQLATFGIDVDPDNCDPVALRSDAEDIRSGLLPLHLAGTLSKCPPVFAADLMDTLADILDARPPVCVDCGAPIPAAREAVAQGKVNPDNLRCYSCGRDRHLS